MYQLTLTASETLVGTAIAVSLAETNEEHRSQQIATWTSFCADHGGPDLQRPLDTFLKQVHTAFVNSVSHR